MTHRALADGAETAYDVARVIWSGELGFHEQRFALVEAISHLERLVRRGPCDRDRSAALAAAVGAGYIRPTARRDA